MRFLESDQMGLTEKLRKILQIKEEIRRAIVEKGVSCTDNTALDQYPERIRRISTVEGGMDTSLCLYRVGALSVVQQMTYCNNGCRSNGAIRHYDGAGIFPLTDAVGNCSRLNLLVEE